MGSRGIEPRSRSVLPQVRARASRLPELPEARASQLIVYLAITQLALDVSTSLLFGHYLPEIAY